MKVCGFMTILLLGLTAGCASRKPALVLPTRGIEVDAFAGSTLSGPVARPVDASSGLWLVNVRAFVTDGALPPGTATIGPSVKLILATRSREPMQPATDLTWAVRTRDALGDNSAESLLGAPASFLAMPPAQSALAPNSTATFTIDSGTVGGYLSLQFNRADSGTAYDLAIVRDGEVIDADRLPAPSTQPLETREAAKPMKIQREVAIVPRAIDQNRDHFLLTAPMSFGQSAGRRVVLEIDLQTTPTPSPGQDVIDAFVAATRKSGEAVTARTSPGKPANPEQSMYAAALKSLTTGGDARATLAYISNQCGATFTESAVLIADRRVLDLLTRQVVDTASQIPGRDRNSMRWILDRSTCLLLAQLAEVETPPCPAELLSILMTQAGEVGAHADALRGVVKEATGPDDLAARLVAENRIFLEDSSPASRVRAYDWLRARGAAPDGFDPLGPPRDRRNALNKANTAH